MEVLAEKSVFSKGEGEPTLAATLLRANFRRLRNSVQEEEEDLFVSAVYTVQRTIWYIHVPPLWLVSFQRAPPLCGWTVQCGSTRY